MHWCVRLIPFSNIQSIRIVARPIKYAMEERKHIRLNNCSCNASDSMLQLIANFNLLQLIPCYKLMPFDSTERITKKCSQDAMLSFTVQALKFQINSQMH